MEKLTLAPAELEKAFSEQINRCQMMLEANIQGMCFCAFENQFNHVWWPHPLSVKV